MKILKCVCTLAHAVAFAFICDPEAASIENCAPQDVERDTKQGMLNCYRRFVDVGHSYMYSRSSTLLQWVKAVLELSGYKTQWVAFVGTTRGSRECGRIEIQNDSEEPYKGVITIIDEGQLSELDNIDLHEYVTNQLKNGDVIINRLILLSSDQPWAKTEQYISEIKNHRDIKYYQVGCNFARCLVCNTTEELGSRLVIKKKWQSVH